jgi:hypothetical protein
MLISEILCWNNEPTEVRRSDPQLGPPSPPFDDDMTHLTNAFTRDGLVKHFWNLNRSEGQPSRPAPPDAETELVPSGKSEQGMASWEAKPVEQESLSGAASARSVSAIAEPVSHRPGNRGTPATAETL